MWPTLTLVCKAAFYAGTAGIIGTAFCAWLFRGHQFMAAILERYGAWSSLLALVAGLAVFFVQVGDLAGEGVAGMANSGLINFLWVTPVGEQLQWRLLGISAVLFACLVGFSRAGRPGIFTRALFATGLIALLYSFQISGHVAQQGMAQPVALVLHVATMGIWIGSLLPLYWFTGRAEQAQVADRLQRFGQNAVTFVALLLLAGGWLLVSLPSAPGAIFSNTWGGTLIFKLALVGILLALAAQNKFSLVPAIGRGEPMAAFRLTVVFELLFALFILLVTAAATSIAGSPA